jgi:imidazolonepropionase-like amidohydrolase
VKTAREVGLEWGGHVSVHVGVRGAIAAKQSTIDHLDDYVEGLEGDESKIAELAKLTKDAGIAVVPTMPLWEVILGLHDPASMNNRPELRYMPPQTRQAWADRVGGTFATADKAAVQKQVTLRNRMLKALSDAGAMVLLGSDAPQLYSVPGFSMQREMETMVAAGMTPFQVLQSGTVNVARFHKNENETGTVAVGRRADLLLVDGNPLQDIRNMNRKSGVMVKGRWLPWSEIQQRLDQIAASYR